MKNEKIQLVPPPPLFFYNSIDNNVTYTCQKCDTVLSKGNTQIIIAKYFENVIDISVLGCQKNGYTLCPICGTKNRELPKLIEKNNRHEIIQRLLNDFELRGELHHTISISEPPFRNVYNKRFRDHIKSHYIKFIFPITTWYLSLN